MLKFVGKLIPRHSNTSGQIDNLGGFPIIFIADFCMAARLDFEAAAASRSGRVNGA
ncbi:MAG: hypothetical protein ACJ8FZ_19815 [Bradyrhizobium sp.]